MAVSADKAAPYAPTSAILELIQRHRSRGLPPPITAEVLARSGVSDSLNSRTLYALQVLDLIDETGQATPTFEAIRKAPEAEYKNQLVEWLNGAYADVLAFVDPATADEVAVRDAFRNYTPVGQQARMVTLFMGLYAAAGVGPEKNAVPRMPRAQRVLPGQPARTPSISANLKSAMKAKMGRPMQYGTDIPEPIMGMLTRLPSNGHGWTQTDRDKFLFTFGTVLDFCFPIVARGANTDGGEDANAA